MSTMGFGGYKGTCMTISYCTGFYVCTVLSTLIVRCLGTLGVYTVYGYCDGIAVVVVLWYFGTPVTTNDLIAYIVRLVVYYVKIVSVGTCY